jgi:hypothetical protein
MMREEFSLRRFASFRLSVKRLFGIVLSAFIKKLMQDKEPAGEGRLQDNEEMRGNLSKPRDISHIDCQEGNMHRGETGGNFSERSEERKQNQEKNPQ